MSHKCCLILKCYITVVTVPLCSAVVTVYEMSQYMRRYIYNMTCYSNTILLQSAVEALGKTYHPEHFTCTQCDKVFDGGFNVNNSTYDVCINIVVLLC